jgi:hypothetical protein
MADAALLRCPHCGGVLLVSPAAVAPAIADDRGAVPVSVERTDPVRTSTSTSNTGTAPPVAQNLPLPLPVTPPSKGQPSTLKRVVAIAHACIRKESDAAGATEAVKQTCLAQGIDPYARDRSGQPLYAVAMDIAYRQQNDEPRRQVTR